MDKKDLKLGDTCHVNYMVLNTQIISPAKVIELLPDKVVVSLNGQEYETDYKNILERMKRPDEVEVKAPSSVPLNSGDLTLKGIRRRR